MYTCSMLPPASLAYLDALGIDVWVRRELLAERSAGRPYDEHRQGDMRLE